MSSNSVGEIGLDLVINQGSYNRQLKNIEGTARRGGNRIESAIGGNLLGITSKIKGIGTALAAAFTVKKLVNFGKECIELGSDLAEVQNVVDVSFPQMSSQVDKFAQSAAASFGLSETMAKRYVGTFGAMTKAFGFTEKEAYDMSTALTGLAGDVASFYNISQDEAYTKLKSVFTGETESLKDLGVVMTQSALDGYAMANGFGKTTSAMTEQEKVALRYQFVMSQLSLAQGDFSRTSGSWANQVRLLKLQFESFMASVGQGLINIFTPVIRMLNVLMGKLVSAANAFKNFTNAIMGKKDNATTSLNNTAAAATNVSNAASGASNSVKKIGDNAKKTAKKMKSLMGFDQINKLEKKQSTGSSSSSGGGGITGGGASGIQSILPDGEEEKASRLAKAYEFLRKPVERLRKSFSYFWKQVKKLGKWAWDEVLKPLGKWVMKNLAPVMVDLLAAAFEYLGTVIEFLSPAIKWLTKRILKPFAKMIGRDIIRHVKMWTTLMKGLTKVLKGIPKVVSKFIEKLKKIPEKFRDIREKIDDFKDRIKGMFDVADLVVTATFTAVKDTAYDTIVDGWNTIKDKTAQLTATVATKWSDLKDTWHNITDNIKDKAADMKATIASKWSDLKDKWHNITSRIKNKTANMRAHIASRWSQLKGTWNKLMSHFKNKVVSIGLKFSAAAKDLKGWINSNVIDRINAKFKKVPVLKHHLIPHLAQGGYVKANTPQLAMIGDNRHQGEVVSPENKLVEMARQAAELANTGELNAEVVALLREILTAIRALNLDVYLDGQRVKKRVVDLINAHTQATGRCEIRI